MVAPALDAISKEFDIINEVEAQLIFSIFILGYAIGPMFLGPLSEIYGRVPVLQLANLFYLAFNIACGFAQSKGEMIAFRFLAGLGGSAPLSVCISRWIIVTMPMNVFFLDWWRCARRLLASR